MTTMTKKILSYSVADCVATLTINNPPVNAMNHDLLQELAETMEALQGDESVRAVVLTGAGRVFIAGADIRILAGIPSSHEGTEMAVRGQAILNKLEQFEKPVIAAINGTCLGGGLELAMCCHIRLAAEGARLGQPEINLGIIPGFGGTQRLTRIIGRSKATQLILTGDTVSAQEARALGLVSEVFSPDDLLRQAQGLGRKIASKGRVAVRAALQAIGEGTDLPLGEGLALEARLFGETCESEDRKEGTRAFLEKRQPRFTHK
jgi:enoyl-CoA hydratase